MAVTQEGCVTYFFQVPFNRENGPSFRATDEKGSLQVLKNKRRFIELTVLCLYNTLPFLGKTLIQRRQKYEELVGKLSCKSMLGEVKTYIKRQHEVQNLH